MRNAETISRLRCAKAPSPHVGEGVWGWGVNLTAALDSLIAMSRALGEPARDYVIIGEGNTSMRLDDKSFVVKASGHQLHDISADGFVALRIDPLLALLDNPPDTYSEIKRITQSAVIPSPRLDGGGPRGVRLLPP